MRAREIFGLIIWFLLLGAAGGLDAGTLPEGPGFLIMAACVAVFGYLALTGDQADANRKGR